MTLGKSLARLSHRTRKFRLRSFNGKVRGDIAYKDDLDQPERTALGNHLSWE